MNNKYITVFLKNKLISFDSIMPLALEINRCCGYKFNFIIWEYDTYKSVIEDNIVLRDMALSIGNITCPNKSRKKNLKTKLKIIFLLIGVVYRANLKKSYVFHFGALDVYPLLFITRLISKDRIALCESSFTGRYTEDLIHQMGINHENDRMSILQHRSSKDTVDKYIGSSYPINNSGILIGFDSEWNWFKHPDANYCNKLVFSKGRNVKGYSDFILKSGYRYLKQEGVLDLEKNVTIIVVLGHFGDGSEMSKYRNRLLYEALTVLRDLDLNIVIKPHIFCDMNLVRSIVKESGCKDNKIYYTKIHPYILQKISVGSVFINNSSVRCEYKSNNFPVITYNGGFGDKVVLDNCSGVVCTNRKTLSLNLELLIHKPYDDNFKKIESKTSDCEKIKEVVFC